MLLPLTRIHARGAGQFLTRLFLVCLGSVLVTHAASCSAAPPAPAQAFAGTVGTAPLAGLDSARKLPAWISTNVVTRSLLVAQRWPTYRWPSGKQINRGPGGYLSWWKLLILWLVFLLWVKTTDWASRDCKDNGLPYAVWIPVVYFPFLIALFAAGLTIPVFAAGAAVTFFAWLIPLLIFVVQRNAQMELHERVMTKDHIRFLAAEYLRSMGIDIGGETKAAHEKGAQVAFQPLGGETEEQNQANFINARQSTGYLPMKEIVHSAFEHRADKIMLDFGVDSMAVKYQVDGVWHDGEDHHGDDGESILEVLKLLSGMDTEVRGKRQSGKFAAEVKKTDLNCQVVAQGTKTGERVLIGMIGAKTEYKTLEELGMREKMIEQYKDLMLQDHGILILSSMPSGGLSTTMNISLRSTDRLLRDFVSIEDVKDRLEEVENVDPTTYNSAKGESPATLLPSLIRKQPDVLVVPDLHDAATVKILCAAAVEDQLVFTTIRAKEAVEALLRVLLMKVPANEFAPVVVGVLNQRLVRKLCETCKEPYAPTPALLKKLGIPQGRVEEFFRHPEDPEEICADCQGIGYVGRTAIFELLKVDDRMREALIKQPKLEVLRKASRLAGNRTLQEEGIAAVVRGITSLPELMRVLKQ